MPHPLDFAKAIQAQGRRLERRLSGPGLDLPDGGLRAMARSVGKQMRGAYDADGMPTSSAPEDDSYAAAVDRERARQASTQPPQPITPRPSTGPLDLPALIKHWNHAARSRRGQEGGHVMPSLRDAILTVQLSQDYASTTQALVKALERRYRDLWPKNTSLAQKERDVANAYHMQPSATGGLPFPPLGNEADKRKWIEDQLDGKNPGRGQGFSLAAGGMSEERRQQLVGALLGKNGTGKTLDWEQVMTNDAPPQPITRERAHEVAGLLMTRRPSRVHEQLKRTGFPLSATAVADADLGEGSDLEGQIVACMERSPAVSDLDLVKVIKILLENHLRLQKDLQPDRPTKPVSAVNKVQAVTPGPYVQMSQPPGGHISMALSVTPAGQEMCEARRRHVVAEQVAKLAKPIVHEPINLSRRR